MKSIRQRKVFKIHTKRLRDAKWDLRLTLSDAKENDELVSLAESTLIRFIDDVNGVNTDLLYEDIRECKIRINELKRGDNTQESRAEIRHLYECIDSDMFIPEYVLLIIDSAKDYRKSVDGFNINGITFHRLLATSSGVKTSTIVYIADKNNSGVSIGDEIRAKINNGRDINVPATPAKLEAYFGLTCSASKVVTSPKNVLVVNDCETKFKCDYILLDDSNDGEPQMTLMKDAEYTLTESDGYGVITPELAETWSYDIGEEELVGGFCTRCAFWKGMLFPFDFRKFAEMNNINTVIDVWGAEHCVSDIDIIAPVSMLKLWDSYKSWDDYWDNCVKNGYSFSVTKVVETNEKETRELNYQFEQSYDLTDDEIDELISPTIDDIYGVMGGDPAKAIIYFRGECQTEKSTASSPNDCYKAMQIDGNALFDPYIRQSISKSIRYKINRTKLGRVRVDGDFMVVSGDPFSLCQSAMGMTVTGLLSPGTIYSDYWDDRGVDEVVCFRAPMSCHNNIRTMKIKANDRIRYWYKYMHNVVIINSWDNLCSALNGMDKDGDTMLTTNNPVLLRNTLNDLTLECTQRKAAKIIPTQSDFVESNIKTFGDDIGSITNRVTSMYDVRSKFPVGSKEYDILTYRIQCGQQYQQNSIDKAKGIECKPMPKYWYDLGAAREQDALDGTSIQSRIVASEKPMFMNYRYNGQMADYNSYMKSARFKSLMEFGVTLDDILKSGGSCAEEAEFIEWFYKLLPVSDNSCTMNRLCRIVDKKTSSIKDSWKQKCDEFDYSIYKSEAVYDDTTYSEVKKILNEVNTRYINALKKSKKSYYSSSGDSMSIKDAILDDGYKRCLEVCSNELELANIVLDLTYGKRCMYHIAWGMIGNIIIRNLLNKNNNTICYYITDTDGDIDYKGKKFKKCEMRVEYDSDNE